RVWTGLAALAAGSVSVCVTTSVTVDRSFSSGQSQVALAGIFGRCHPTGANTQYPGYRFGRVLTIAATMSTCQRSSARGAVGRDHAVDRLVGVHADAERFGGADDDPHHDGREVG